MSKIDEGLLLEINGRKQWITIRGNDRTNPVLFLVFGPGAAMSPLAPFFSTWEDDFTLVQWDQPGAGVTSALNPGIDDIDLERLIVDAIEVAQIAHAQVDTDEIVYVGFSGGTIVGLHVVQSRPDLFSAYVGSGQFVNWRRQDQLSYEMLLKSQAGDPTAIEELTKLGPPPYPDADHDAVKSKYATALTSEEQAGMMRAPSIADATTPVAGANYIAQDVVTPDPRTQAFAMYRQLRPELVAFDAWEMDRRFDLPLVFLQGEHESYAVTAEVQRYQKHIDAPSKQLTMIRGGGHSPFMMRRPFLDALKRHLGNH